MSLFFIHTFGCQMNQYDSEKVAGLLTDNGWTATENPELADLIIVNSCSVREKPLQKVFSYMGRFIPQREKHGTRLFVMGCVAQQLGKEIIDRAPHIDAVFGPGAEHLIPQVAAQGLFPFISNNTDLLERKELFPSTKNRPGSHSAFVTIMHGCDNWCSYCIVPSVRGKEVSRDSSIILEELSELINSGVTEITLLGQNVNSYYDLDTGMDFSALLEYIAAKVNLKRLRFVTSHPKDFSPRLAALFKQLPILMPYLHLPAQAGSDRILRLMNRGYTRDQYSSVIRLARDYCPDISISSDFIVGFPGETEAEFLETVSLIEEIGYDTIFAFKYSPRPGTKAAELSDETPDELKLERLNLLLDRQRTIMKKVRNRFLNRTVNVLIEEESPRGGSFMGRNEHNLIVHVTDSTASDLGKIVPVYITEILENTLRGAKQQ